MPLDEVDAEEGGNDEGDEAAVDCAIIHDEQRYPEQPNARCGGKTLFSDWPIFNAYSLIGYFAPITA